VPPTDSVRADAHSRNGHRLVNHAARVPLASLSVAAALLDARGMVVDCNDAFRELIGPLPDTPIELRFSDCFGTETDAATRVNTAITHGELFLGELLCYTRTGAPFWNDLHLIPVARESSDDAVMLALLRDVTARRTAATALNATSPTDRMLLDRIQAGVLVHSATTDVLYANAKANELLGVSHETVLGAVNSDPRWSFVREDGSDMPMEEYPVARCIATGTAIRNLVVGVKRFNDSKLMWLLGNAYPVLNANGAVAEVVVSFTDVTELKQAERARGKSEERLQYVLQGSKDGWWDWDIETDAIYYSPSWWAMLGYEMEELPVDSRTWSRLLHADDQSAALSQLQARLDSDVESFELEFRLRHKDGHYVRVLCRGFVLRDAEGQPVRVSGTNTDITERHALEERLQQSQKMEAIGQLAGGVAHDFNNLLAVIVGNLELIDEAEAGSEEARIGLADAMSAAQRGADLTHRLLAFSRRQPMQATAVEPGRVVESLSSVLRRIIAESISVYVDVARDLPPIRIDGSLLENALLNLAINARDAMPAGGALRISASLIDSQDASSSIDVDLSPGQYVWIAVADSGTGMTADVQRRAMEPFFTTKPAGSGTGLGLSMVYAFVKQSGGGIRIESQLGQGTTIHVYLPVASGAEAGAPRATELSPKELRGGGEVVLVVEDDESVRRLCVRALRSLDYTPMPASDGPDALSILERTPDVAVLLTDMVMPNGMSGKQLADTVRERWPHVRVIYMSGYTANMLNVESLDAPRLLGKPFTTAELGQSLRDVLRADRVAT
jgi:PAS domain S-box-containing protein